MALAENVEVIGWQTNVEFDGRGAFEELVNFESWNFAKDPDQLRYLRVGIETFMAESLMLPTERMVVVDPFDGIVEQDGRRMSSVFERAIKHFQGNNEVVRRFESERDGFRNAENLVFAYANRFGTLPPFVIASPPGEVYSNDERAKSLTFVGLPYDIDERGSPRYLLYSIPSDELEMGDHLALVESVASTQQSLELLNLSLDVNDTNSIVAFPLILGDVESGLDKLVRVLGYEDWGEVIRGSKIAASFFSFEDETQSRRAGIIRWFENQIQTMVERSAERAEFAVLDEVMRQTFAAERGGFFLENKINKNEMEMFLQRQLDGEGYIRSGSNVNYTQLWEGYVESSMIQREMLIQWIMTNSRAYDSYVVTGCGGGSVGGNELLLTNEDIYEAYDLGVQSQYSINGLYGLGEESSSSATSSGGKYTEYYNYEPGLCAKCKRHKQFVAKPKSREIKCAGWCSDCEK